MGYIRHHAIIVTTWKREFAILAREYAQNLGMQASEILETSTNGVMTFMVGPDGSKEFWPESDSGDKRRADFIIWLDTMRWEDGSTPMKWVEVQYGDEEGVTLITAHSDEQFRQVAGTLE